MAIDFGSASDYTLGTATPLELTGDLTWAGWLKTTTGSLSVLMGCYNNSDFDGWGVGIGVNVAGKVDLYTKGGGWDGANTASNDGNWTHIAITISGTSGTHYRNGSSDGTMTTGVHGASGTAKRIGASTGEEFFSNSALAEVAVWGVALSAAEVASLAAGFSPAFVRPASMVGYWPLVRGGFDKGRNSLAGTASGSPSVVAHPRIIYPRRRAAFSVTAAAASYSSAFFRENAGVGAMGGGPFARANAGLGAIA